MGKDSEAGEKLKIRGKENGLTGRKRQHVIRGKRTNQRTCLCLVQGKEKNDMRNAEAGRDVDTVFCLFPSKATGSSAVKRKGKEDWKSQRCA